MVETREDVNTLSVTIHISVPLNLTIFETDCTCWLNTSVHEN